ncbi:MAG: HEAT repeat domain-containing protein [Planctomycetota bacterium]
MTSTFGHGGLFRGPSGRVPGQQPSTAPPTQGGASGGQQQALPAVYPGSGPQIPFNEERWEFWWEYNQDTYVNVRDKLIEAERPQQGLRPFVVPSLDERRKDLIPFLVTSALTDEDDQVRSAGVFSLAKLADPFTVAYLEHIAATTEPQRQQGKAVYESNLAVRINAVVALGVMQSQRAVDTLKHILHSEQETDETRCYAATSLGMISGPEASNVLKQCLEPATLKLFPYQLRLALCYAIGLTHDPDNAAIVRPLVQESEDYLVRALLIQSLGQLADSAANKLLLDQLKSKETMVRRSAALALGACAQDSEKEIVEGLMRTARSDSDNVTTDFCHIALGRIGKGGNPAIGQFLLEELNRVTHQRRAFVLLALGLLRNKDTEDRLLKVFEDEKELSLRGAAAIALGLVQSAKAIAPLRAALEGTPDPVFRSYVALALGMVGDTGSAKVLKRFVVEEVDVELLDRSAVALGMLGDRSVIPDLLNDLKRKPEQMVRAAHLYAVGKLGGKEYAPELMAIARTAARPIWCAPSRCWPWASPASPPPCRSCRRSRATPTTRSARPSWSSCGTSCDPGVEPAMQALRGPRSCSVRRAPRPAWAATGRRPSSISPGR